ncbi:MAG: hypothetical protein MZV49_21160 [Rhodopseudomonas palustris]|nr:hypothetical protein [Rhodopseudomonas palustris]
MAFAAEFDPQPMHLDDEAARHSMLGGLSGSGLASVRADDAHDGRWLSAALGHARLARRGRGALAVAAALR